MQIRRAYGQGCSRVGRVLLYLLFSVMVAGTVSAQLQLFDRNSSVTIVPNSQAGMNQWLVDGVSVLNQQWFWFRVGTSGGQSSLDTLPLQYVLSDTNPFTDPRLDTFSALYTGAGFTIEVKFTLDGSVPGSGTADLAEQIDISNTSAAPLDFHFFQYCDFNLSLADTAQYLNSNTVQQAGGSALVTETVFTPAPSHREAALAPTLLNLLNGGLPATLNDNLNAGPGDAEWANEWDATIGVGQSLLISKDKHVVVPEPTGLALTVLGLGGLLLLSRSRKH